MTRPLSNLTLAALALIASVGCGGGGGGSATSTRELLTGGSSKVWKVSQAHANAKFRGGSDNPETFAPCPTRFGSLSPGLSDWTCGESDTIVFREDGTVDYSVGEISWDENVSLEPERFDASDN